VTSPTQIIWLWEPVPGAAGYMWSPAGNYNTATDIGTSTSQTQTGLTCQTYYSSYVWSYSDGCGHSPFTPLSAWTSADPPPAPVESLHYVHGDTIIWQWDTMPGAQLYRLAKENDYNQPIYLTEVPWFCETGLHCNWDYTRYLWAVGPCGYSVPVVLTQTSSPYPVTPVADEHISTSTTITWRWQTVPGASGYSWNFTNDLSTSIPTIAQQPFFTETGLACGETYTRYAWAWNLCGEASLQAVTLIASTFSCINCGFDSLIVNHNVNGGVAPVNKTVIYSTVTGIPGEPEKCWIAQNLGADRQALSVDDASSASAGWYWQFNRMRGHAANIHGYYWYPLIEENSDWLIANDPCRLELGFPWRMPTEVELGNIDNAENWNDWNDPWNSALKLHAAGMVDVSAQGVAGYCYLGEWGLYWSSTQSLNYPWANTLYFTSDLCRIDDFYIWDRKRMAHSIRCLRE
jgi:hypothetical protein